MTSTPQTPFANRFVSWSAAELPQEAPQKRQRVRARTAIAPFTILGAAITACMMILVIFGYVQLFEASSRV